MRVPRIRRLAFSAFLGSSTVFSRFDVFPLYLGLLFRFVDLNTDAAKLGHERLICLAAVRCAVDCSFHEDVFVFVAVPFFASHRAARIIFLLAGFGAKGLARR